MNTGAKDGASGTVPTLSAEEASERLRGGEALLVDVREPAEVSQSGMIKGAVNIPLGMVGFCADPEGPYHDPEFRKDRTLLLYCARGGRSEMAARTLQEMGYMSVFNIGGFRDLADAGLETEFD